MKKYKFEVQEILSRNVEIEAETEQEAEEIIREMYRNEEIVLDWNDFIDSSIELVEEL